MSEQRNVVFNGDCSTFRADDLAVTTTNTGSIKLSSGECSLILQPEFASQLIDRIQRVLDQFDPF